LGKLQVHPPEKKDVLNILWNPENKDETVLLKKKKKIIIII